MESSHLKLTRVDQGLLEELAREEARLAQVERERREVQVRINRIKSELASDAQRPAAAVPSVKSTPTLSGTAEEEAELFRNLFRGRDDVFPRLWINSRTGKKGYAPACANEWVRGVCEKPRVRCGECPNQAFLPVTDKVILDHLEGRHVIGTYPLLRNETCWLLAVDFDKAAWKEDVTAYVAMCRAVGLDVAVERSRSGNGAHVWFFFDLPICATVARKMACYLITETMSRRPQLSMESYDRLFPNQDTMPKGGFGNLIALPLQHEAVKKGNTLFLDENLMPHANQWAFLRTVRKIETQTVDLIAREAIREGKVIGVRFAETEGEDECAPWTSSPTFKKVAPIPEPIPNEIRAVLAQRVYVEKTGLPPALLNRIKRLAAFQNPEFYKKQKMRLSTAMTPRVISCAEELSRFVALPRGCLDDLEELLRAHGSSLVVEDQRTVGTELTAVFDGSLTPLQQEAANALARHDIGILVAPPGVGKTVVGTYLTAYRKRNTLILVHRRPLLDQWVAQLSLFFGEDSKAIGVIGGGKSKATARLDVAMIQSLVRKGKVDDRVQDYGHVIVDECHHVPAFSFERILSAVKAKYVTGLTATPRRRDGHHPILQMQLGPTRFVVHPRSPTAERPFHRRLIVRETGFLGGDLGENATIQELYKALSEDERRNGLILDDVIRSIVEGRSPILLTERRDHLEYFAEQPRKAVKHVVVLRGGMGAKARREKLEELASIPESEERLLLATGRYIGEGFDDARLDTLFLALPVSWKGTLVQYTGRLHRIRPGKTEVRIFDYVDSRVLTLRRMFERRLRGYRALGYATEDEGSRVGETTAIGSARQSQPRSESPAQ